MMRWSGASSDQCAGLVMISEKRSVRPCFYFPSCVSSDIASRGNKTQRTHLENGTNVDLVRVGKTQERGLRRTLLKRSDCSFHGRVLLNTAQLALPHGCF